MACAAPCATLSGMRGASWLWLAACGPPPAHAPATADTGSAAAADSAAPADTGSAEPDTAPALGCPPEMVPVRDGLGEPVYCIDAFEVTLDDMSGAGARDQGAGYPDGTTTAAALSVEGVVPSTVVSWYQAVAACLNADKYLCSSQEWQDACDGTIGDGGQEYPWGDDWVESACALPAEDGSLVFEALQPTGSVESCASPVGAYDMAGNAWEWADPMATDGSGLPVTDKRGGAYYSGRSNAWCSSALFGEHTPDFTGTIAARCCATPSLQQN